MGEEIDPHAADPVPGSADLCFLVDLSIDALLSHQASLGVSPELGPVQRTGATGPLVSVYIRDPDGNLIELSRTGTSAAETPENPFLFESDRLLFRNFSLTDTDAVHRYASRSPRHPDDLLGALHPPRYRILHPTGDPECSRESPFVLRSGDRVEGKRAALVSDRRMQDPCDRPGEPGRGDRILPRTSKLESGVRHRNGPGPSLLRGSPVSVFTGWWPCVLWRTGDRPMFSKKSACPGKEF